MGTGGLDREGRSIALIVLRSLGPAGCGSGRPRFGCIRMHR
jgi:hypothetical protein